MRYYYGNKSLDIKEEELEYSFIGKGKEGNSYKIGDSVLKIYHKIPEKSILSKNDCNKLTKIKTSRVILPDNLLYNEHGDYIGYTSKHIQEEKTNFNNLKVRDFLNEFALLEQDVKALSRNNFDLYDLNIGNTVFSDGIYLVDAGSYRSNDFDKFVDYFNRLSINEYEVSEILCNLYNFNKEEIRNLKQYVEDDSYYFSQIINSFGCDYNENAKVFFKGMAR